MKCHEILPEIIRAIGEVESCSPLDLDYSLYNYADTTAIRSLWASEKTEWELTFQVPDHTVVIRGNGEILVDGDVVRKITDLSQEQVK
jgi:hypothetical protein